MYRPDAQDGVELLLEPIGFAPARTYQKELFHAGIPLSFGLAQDQLTMVNNHILSDFKTQFNRDQYLAELKMQLNQKINFSQYISALEDPLSAIKTLAEEAFRKKLDETNGK